MAPHLVARFLQEADYDPALVPKVLDLVVCHHDYDKAKSCLLQLLMEADLLVNCYENPPDRTKADAIQGLFRTEGGKTLLALYLQGQGQPTP